MDRLFPDKIWNYKNFNMVTELDIAGEFIYDGIHRLNQMRAVNEDAGLFSFLYHTAVGIERLQKIVIVLFEEVNQEEYEEFEKSLITHSHTGLQERIKTLTKIDFNARENRFLHILTSFYNSIRYDRFNLNTYFEKEQQLFSDYLVEHIGADKLEYDLFYKKVIILTPETKEILGRIIGNISKKYYELVREGCKKAGTFTYELRTDSKAEKVFLSRYKKNSLQMQIVTEKVALKELLVYLRRSKEKHPLLYHVDSIEPLEFDPAFLNDYINEISNGTIPQSLVDQVEYLYEESKHSIARVNNVDVIGNPNVDFDFYAVHQCFILMNELLSGRRDPVQFANAFCELFEMIDEDYVCDELSSVLEQCKLVLRGEVSSEAFVSMIETPFKQIKDMYNYQTE